MRRSPPAVSSTLMQMLRLLGGSLAMLSVGGEWGSALRTERAVCDQNDAALARYAATYLAVITPTSPAGFDVHRLVSAANTIADASFWPGGFQMALGSVALVSDTIGLLPLPDSVVQVLEAGASSVVTTHAHRRVTVVPLDSATRRDGFGWAAAWDTLTPNLTSPVSLGATALALAGIAFAIVLRFGRRPAIFRMAAVGTGLFLLLVLTLVLGRSVRRTATNATAIELLTARRLIEIAATASWVKQDRLAAIGAGLQIREIRPPAHADPEVQYDRDPRGSVARVVAMTPRSDGALELRRVPVEAGLGAMWRSLAVWLGAGVISLLLAVGPAGLSGPAGLFHVTGGSRGPRP